MIDWQRVADIQTDAIKRVIADAGRCRGSQSYRDTMISAVAILRQAQSDARQVIQGAQQP